MVLTISNSELSDTANTPIEQAHRFEKGMKQRAYPSYLTLLQRPADVVLWDYNCRSKNAPQDETVGGCCQAGAMLRPAGLST